MTQDPLSPRTSNTFKHWDIESSVRSRPNRYLLTQEAIQSSTTKNWFPPIMLPFLRHPAISVMPDHSIKYLQAHYLVHFLDYTTTLEHTIVNRAVENIVHDRMGITFNKNVRDAGLKIYTDEGYHAQYSAVLAEQVANHFTLARMSSARISKLNDLLRSADQKHLPLVQFLVGFVSETVIATELLDLTRHKLITPVHHAFRDHLHDEARHAQYFSECFVSVWQHLPTAEKLLAVDYIIEILDVFCQFDEPWLSISLMSCPTPPVYPHEIINESRKWATERRKLSALGTLEAIKRTDLLNTTAFKKSFVQQGLIDEC
ncbi:diiron oxygenase [Pseudomonas rubra]|uniref:Diiron oxygenase n=1 Tax=Pseudomonas rubra TaxID=2942627 RepID=A0ABT5P7C5_9PSED|nr:diiron oxygenase [Pseudomonas rubra]MDD1013924.1 diiron oxygenase [Pseudomonas rubra]MDD1038858.1 diiron oxygenase [Pseudomonas rubra]MDD1154388.1 diiron oxygenase [Pseudomonas rubra]